MRISVITVVKDNKIGLQKTIKSIRSQDYKNIEHIIVDGLSTDGTLDIISEMMDEKTMVISERDYGIYDAINKGIKISTGKVIGVLHSGDIYASNSMLSRVAQKFLEKNIEAVFADVEYVDYSGIVRRKYSSKHFSRSNLKYGMIMAHTSLFLSNDLYQKFGLYNKNYKIAGDFELIAKIFSNDIRFEYDEMVYIKMILGGVSNKSVWNRFIINIEILKACKSNDIQTNFLNLMYRYILKINEFKILK